MQTQTRDEPGQRMCTMEKCLARLVRAGKVDRREAERSSNHPQLLSEELDAG